MRYGWAKWFTDNQYKSSLDSFTKKPWWQNIQTINGFTFKTGKWCSQSILKKEGGGVLYHSREHGAFIK